MAIPTFREDGYLPEGLHPATEAEATFRFGSSTRRRRALALRLRHCLYLARTVETLRFLLDGSFITSKPDPVDIDAVVYLPSDFERQVREEAEPAVELQEILTSRSPGDLFAAEDASDWMDWVDFFSRTREADGRRKGLVEIVL